jgi:putative Ca2+/H+ antiporter (TMEM165/GDT1 family)
MLRTVLYTFFLVFIAELGDKTQLATMLLSAKSNSIMSIFIGSSLALVCSSFIGVFAGAYITKYIPPHYIQNSAGVLFIAMGILILTGKI